MREVFVPDFNIPLVLQYRQMSIDLVSLKIDGLRIVGDHVHGESAFASLARMSVRDRDGRAIRLFNPCRRSGSQTREGNRRPARIAVRKEVSVVEGIKIVPMFTGRLQTQRGRYPPANESHGSREYTDVTIYLEFNFARFLSGQSYFRRSDGTVQMSWPEAFAIEKSTPRHEGEVAFGNEGNLVIGADEIYEHALNFAPVRQFIRALDSLMGAIVEELRSYSLSRDIAIEYEPSYGIRRAEWYAEYSAHDPRRELNRIMPILSRVGVSGNVFRKQLTAKVFRFDPHSHAFQTQLKAGVRQTTYSKSNRRLRFEVKYSQKGVSSVFGRRSGLSDAGLRRALIELRDDASRELERVFGEINRVFDAIGNCRYNRDDLVLWIATFAESPSDADEIVFSLRDVGRVAVEPGSPLRGSIDRLARRHILRPVRRSVYSVTDNFQCALRQLMSQEDAALAEQARAMSNSQP